MEDKHDSHSHKPDKSEETPAAYTSTSTNTTSQKNNTLYTAIAIVIVIALCLCSCCVLWYFSMKKAEERNKNFLDELSTEMERQQDESSERMEDVQEGADDVVRDFVPVGEAAGNADWDLAVTGSVKEGDEIIVAMNIVNRSSVNLTLSSFLSFRLLTKPDSGNETKIYYPDIFYETNKGYIDEETPAGEAFTAQMAFKVTDDSSLNEVYLEFKPDFLESEVYNYDLE